MMILLTPNQVSPTPTFDNVSEYGLFTNSGNPDWFVPTQGAAVPTTLVGSSQAAIAEFGAVTTDNLVLGTIPEPATGMLAILGCGALAWARRRSDLGLKTGQKLAAIIAVVMAQCLLVSEDAVAGSVTIDFTAQLEQRNVTDASGELVRAGSGEVRLGVVSDFFDPATQGEDLERVREAWIPLGSTPIESILGEESRFSAAATIRRPELEGRQLYLWILQTPEGAPIAADLSNVSEYGLYSSTDENWTVPSEGAFPPENTTIINSSQINQAFGPTQINAASLRLTLPRTLGFGYDSWVAGIFPNDTPEEQKLPNADPDNDELSNLLELFTGNNPLVPNSRAPLSIALTEQSIVLQFERSKSAPAAAASIEISGDLSKWLQIENLVKQISTPEVSPSKDLVEVRLPRVLDLITTIPELYVRLSVTDADR